MLAERKRGTRKSEILLIHFPDALTSKRIGPWRHHRLASIANGLFDLLCPAAPLPRPIGQVGEAVSLPLSVRAVAGGAISAVQAPGGAHGVGIGLQFCVARLEQ